jgi:ribosomal subunit interface protein
MKINIKSTNFELTPAIAAYIKKKIDCLEKLLSEANAVLDIEVAKTTRHHSKGKVFSAEANLKLAGRLLRVEKKAEDLRAAIDEIKDCLSEQIKKIKESRRN